MGQSNRAPIATVAGSAGRIDLQVNSRQTIPPAASASARYNPSMKIKSGRPLSVLALLVVSLAEHPRGETPVRLPRVENHWAANTSGTKEGHIANFLTDMVVYYPTEKGSPSPLVLTASFWDEGSCGFCSYANGQSNGKSEWWKDTIHSDRAWYKGRKCSIGNFWGRAFLSRNAPPPIGDSAPYVACDGHDTLRSVVDPTAVAFDRAGNLLVADNGPDQNVKIFSMTAGKPSLLRTFGDSGGVFAGPVPGRAGTRRFWGIRGLAVDSAGILYVGNTGIPMQTMGGTDIRAFSGKDSSLLWQVQGLSFVNSADVDPASAGRDLYLNAKRFEMDYSKAPGASWKLASVTLDPFRYPGDPRIVQPMESVWIRRIQGRKFQYHTEMYGGFVYVVRFSDSSEIGIPTAFICAGGDRTTGWGSDSAPQWERNETNKRLRWYWVDRNGDGIAQKAEYGTYENYNSNNQGLDVDENGDIWLGGAGKVDTYFRGGGTTRFTAGVLDAKGVPRFDPKVKRFDIPYSENRGGSVRLKYLASADAMFLATSPNSWYASAIYRYDHYTDSTRRVQTCRIDAGFDDQGKSSINLDQNTVDMTLPYTFTADTDFVYVTYLDNGRYSRKRGEVTVYDARTCAVVGWIAPGPETGNFAGAVDLVNGINVATDSDGHKLVLVEEDGAGKVMVYRWCPDGASCKSAGISPRFRSLPSFSVRRHGLVLEAKAPEGSHLDLRDASGRMLWTGTLAGSATDGWRTIPTSARGLVFASLRLGDGTVRSERFLLP